MVDLGCRSLHEIHLACSCLLRLLLATAAAVWVGQLQFAPDRIYKKIHAMIHLPLVLHHHHQHNNIYSILSIFLRNCLHTSNDNALLYRRVMALSSLVTLTALDCTHISTLRRCSLPSIYCVSQPTQ